MDVVDVVVIGAGVLLAGFLWWFFFGPKQIREASVVGGVQEVDITVKGGYSPSLIRAQQGVPLRLNFDRQESGDCTSRVAPTSGPNSQTSGTLNLTPRSTPWLLTDADTNSTT